MGWTIVIAIIVAIISYSSGRSQGMREAEEKLQELIDDGDIVIKY